jgi:hypothetical protein
MNGDFFVQIVNNDGNLGRLYGPATWDEAIAKVKAYVTQQGPTGETLEQAFESVDLEGCYEWGGEGIFIVQAEPIDAALPGDEEDDEDEYTVELGNGGCMEFDPSDGAIRYIDSDGNTENVWYTDDPEYDQTKEQYFPEAEIDPDDEDEELRRDEKHGLYGGQIDSAN